MQLARLTAAEVHRDGGSYSASFETDDGRDYNIWLQCTRFPDAEGLHHRWLFEYFGRPRRSEMGLPLVTGSQQERVLIDRLKDFLASDRALASGSVAKSRMEPVVAEHARTLLQKLIRYIERRDACSAIDVDSLQRRLG